MAFHDAHRPLRDLLGALERAGLLVEAVREPVPDAAHVAAHPGAARYRERPIFLHVRALKPRIDQPRLIDPVADASLTSRCAARSMDRHGASPSAHRRRRRPPRSFTSAAEELHLAQSAISQQIRRLETELGVEVFRRSSRSVEVTPEGRLLVEHAHRVLAEVDHMHSELRGAHRPAARPAARSAACTRPARTTSPRSWPTSARAPRRRRSTWSRTPPDALLAALREDALDCATPRRPRRARRRVRRDAAVRGGVRRRAAGRPRRCSQRPHVTFDSSRPRTSSPTATTPRCGAAWSATMERARARAAQRVRLHRDGRGPRAGQQGPGRRGHAALGRRGARPADRAAARSGPSR